MLRVNFFSIKNIKKREQRFKSVGSVYKAIIIIIIIIVIIVVVLVVVIIEIVIYNFALQETWVRHKQVGLQT